MWIKARPDLVVLEPFDVVGQNNDNNNDDDDNIDNGNNNDCTITNTTIVITLSIIIIRQMRFAQSKDCVMSRFRAAKGDFPDLTRGHKSYGYCWGGCDEKILKDSPPGTFILDDMIFVAPGAQIKGVRDAWVSAAGPRALPQGLKLPMNWGEVPIVLGYMTHGVRLCALHFSGAPLDSRWADHLPDVLKCKGEFSQRVTCGQPFTAGNQGGGVPPPCPYPFLSSSPSPPPVCSGPEPPPRTTTTTPAAAVAPTEMAPQLLSSSTTSREEASASSLAGSVSAMRAELASVRAELDRLEGNAAELTRAVGEARAVRAETAAARAELAAALKATRKELEAARAQAAAARDEFKAALR